MSRLVVVLLSIIAVAASACRPDDNGAAAGQWPAPIVGLPCEGCEAVFQGLPDTLDWRARIAAENEPGAALRIEGTVRDLTGRAISGVVVYAYHTDARGLYPTDDRLGNLAAARHGRLRAWAASDDLGRYRFDTIRPAGYPDSDLPAHVHLHVLEVGRCTYYIDDILFDDDPRLSAAHRLTPGRGGNGLVTPTRNADGSWLVTRDIILGEAIPGYP